VYAAKPQSTFACKPLPDPSWSGGSSAKAVVAMNVTAEIRLRVAAKFIDRSSL